MRTKLFLLVCIFLLGTGANALAAGIIFGQLSEIPENGTVTYVAKIGDNWQEILTEDNFNSGLGLNGGYQENQFFLNAENFTKISNGELVVIEFSCIVSESRKVGNISVIFEGSFQDAGTIPLGEADSPIPVNKPQVEIIQPGIVWLNWEVEKELRRVLTYRVYRSTQASGANNLASNGRYQLIAPRVRPPYIDNTVPSTKGTQVWYLIIAEDAYGRISGHSPEAYVPDTSMWLRLENFNTEFIDNSIKLTWDLAQPAEIQGFDVYRSSKLNGKYLKLNPEIITNSNSTIMTYHYADSKIEQENQQYFYYLEAIALEGKSVKSNPLEISIP